MKDTEMLDEDFEKEVAETLKRLYEEEDGAEAPAEDAPAEDAPAEEPPAEEPPAEEPAGDEPADDSPEAPTDDTPQGDDTPGEDAPEGDMPPEGGEGKDDGDAEKEKGDEPEFTATSLQDFLDKTEAKVTVKKEGKMPSPIFKDKTQNHNKYRVTVETPKGKASFTFWDSIANTVANKPLDVLDALAAFGMDCAAIDGIMSFEDFKSEFGYENADDALAQKAFDGCRKQLDKAKVMFDDAQLEELKRLAGEH